MNVRITFYVDRGYDGDILDALASLPERRKSERIRQLLRLGLAVEQDEARPVRMGSVNIARQQSSREEEEYQEQIASDGKRKRFMIPPP